MIAIAISCNPKLLIADEPTTALDVMVQAQIIELLGSLRRELGLAVILVTHDLGVVTELCERVLVMYGGMVAEQGATADLFTAPRHPYTQALLASVLTPEPGLGVPDVGLGDIMPDPANIPPGCRFNPRCRIAVDKCRSTAPETRTDAAKGMVECHLAEA